MINMMDILPNILFLIAVIVIVSIVIALPIGLLFRFYFKKKTEHMEMRIKISKEIVNLTAKMREKAGSFSDKQKENLNFLIDISESKSFIRFYFKSLLFNNTNRKAKTSKRAVKELETVSGFSKDKDSEMFGNFITLIVLCILMASTYNFFLGGLFRKRLYSYALKSSKSSKSSKPAETRVKQKDFICTPIFPKFVESMPLVA